MEQKTFPKVAKDKHPKLSSEKSSSLHYLNGNMKPCEADLEIASEIIQIKNSLQIGNNATGEWDWINKNARRQYLSTLASNNVEGLADILCNFFRRDAGF